MGGAEGRARPRLVVPGDRVDDQTLDAAAQLKVLSHPSPPVADGEEMDLRIARVRKRFSRCTCDFAQRVQTGGVEVESGGLGACKKRLAANCDWAVESEGD